MSNQRNLSVGAWDLGVGAVDLECKTRDLSVGAMDLGVATIDFSAGAWDLGVGMGSRCRGNG